MRGFPALLLFPFRDGISAIFEILRYPVRISDKQKSVDKPSQMRKVRNAARLRNEAIKNGNPGKDHNEILCLHGEKVKDNRAIGEKQGKGHFDGKNGAGSSYNRDMRRKYTTTYPGKNTRRKIERQKTPLEPKTRSTSLPNIQSASMLKIKCHRSVVLCRNM